MASGTLKLIDDLFKPPLHVAPPECDCHQAAECEHDMTIECETCGEKFSSGSGHTCGTARPAQFVQVSALEVKRWRRIETRAKAAVRAHADNSTNDFFFDVMIELAKAVSE